MNFFISLIYAPIVFYSLKNFELKTVSIAIFIFSLLWLSLVVKKGLKEFIFPLFYLFISILAYFLDNFLLLKMLPLLISILISLFMFYTYFSKNSFIFIFLDKIKKKVEEKEKEYIQKSTLFWSFSSLVNICLHVYVLYVKDLNYWIIYSSFGWYFVFLISGIIQFIHKQIYFNKEKNV